MISPPAMYRDSRIWQMREYARNMRAPFIVIFADLDDTFYHPEVPNVSQQLYTYCQEKKWPIVILTGNSFNGVMAKISNGILPAFSVIVGHVSTDMWIQDAQNPLTYRQDTDFEEYIRQRKFDRGQIIEKGFNLIQTQQKKLPEFAFQNTEAERKFIKTRVTQEPYKVSFFLTASSVAKVARIKTILENHFKPYTVLISDHTAYNRTQKKKWPKKFCLDILPLSKGDAVNYLARLLAIKKGIVAGDSGNDIQMLMDTPPQLLSVLVGGSKAEALAAIRKATISHDTHQPGIRVIVNARGSKKLCYVEPDTSRRGPESILKALTYIDQKASLTDLR